MPKQEKQLIEAALFLSSRAMSLDEFRTLTGIGALGYLQSLITELKNDYDSRESAIEIVEADGKYYLRVRSEHIDKVKQFAQESELSKSALRTLAYISKNDGILKSTLVKKIGTHVYTDVKELAEADFIKTHKAGRTSKIVLTEKFKKYFSTVSASGQPSASQEVQTSL